MSEQPQPEPKDAPQPNWVAVHSACTLPNVFRSIRQRVEADVKARNDIRPHSSPYEFTIGEGDDEFKVSLKHPEIHKSVFFSLTKNAIVILDDKRIKMFEVTSTFNDKSECILSVDHEPRELWQISRLALEGIFF